MQSDPNHQTTIGTALWFLADSIERTIFSRCANYLSSKCLRVIVDESKYNYQALRDGSSVTFDETMPIALVPRAVDHCFRFMDGYRKGLTGPVLEFAVKKYKSHRRLSTSLQLEKVEKDFRMKQETMMG